MNRNLLAIFVATKEKNKRGGKISSALRPQEKKKKKQTNVTEKGYKRKLETGEFGGDTKPCVCIRKGFWKKKEKEI